MQVLTVPLGFLMLMLGPSAAAQTDKCPGDLLVDVGSSVPGFGGLFVDEAADTLYVYLVDPTAADAVALDRALTEQLGRARPPQHRLQVLSGRYTYEQLHSWANLLEQNVLGIPGVGYTYVDDRYNRLRVGVAESAAVSIVEAKLLELSIPLESVTIEQASAEDFAPLRPEEPDNDSLPPGTLRDRYRPVVGGIQIEIDQKNTRTITDCTLGFNAKRATDRGFVTANHCINDPSNPKSAIFFQPTEGTDNRIGVGLISPPSFTMAKNKKCLEGDKCRYADVMFVKLDDSAQSSQGIIARPAVGSSNWNGTDTFSITDRARPAYGMSVTMVGSQTGRIEGQITVAQFSLRGPDDIRYLCQTIVDWKTKPVSGDSGSPAFAIGRNNEVSLLGIVWGTKAVSPIVNIETSDELGPTLQTCIEGKKC